MLVVMNAFTRTLSVPVAWVTLFLCGVFFAVPVEVYAEDFVSCGGPDCTACDLLGMAQDIVFWLAAVMTIIATIFVLLAGMQLVISVDNADTRSVAKRLLTNSIIGLVIVLASWFFVDTIMKILLNNSTPVQYGVWHEITCDPQRTFPRSPAQIRINASAFSDQGFDPQGFPVYDTPGRVTAAAAARGVPTDTSSPSPSTPSGSTPENIEGNIENIRDAGETAEMARAAALEAGLTEEQADYYVALVQKESSMCQNKVGPQTKYGQAYGCSQMLLSTARGLDPSATPERLTNDDAYSLAMGAEYFRSRLELYDGDTTRALAAYNGGTKANEQSSVCPGMMAWQCPRNSGYQQTRDYVSTIDGIVDGL
jgi:hypothetical protein